MTTAGELLTRALRARGVEAVYGSPRLGMDVIAAGAAVAPLLAAAHRRVHGQRAAVLSGSWLRIGEGPAIEAAHPEDLMAAVDAGSVHLDVDLLAPAPDLLPEAPAAGDRWLEPDATAVALVSSATLPTALIGPGVVEERAVPGLHAVATALSIGVLNTWGAKGIFDWRSRHHYATVGLQERDFELGGLPAADLILTSGLDPLEAPTDRWQLAASVDVSPGALGPLAQLVSRPPVELIVPPLRTGLAAVTQDGWGRPAPPLMPTRVTLHYGRVFGAGGLVAADPGLPGYWVARTFSTTELGTAVVPAEADAAGFAVACCLVARLRRPARAVLAVTDDAASADPVLDAAAHLGVPVPVEVWEPGGPVVGADAHLTRLRRMALSPDSRVERLGTDPTQLARMIDIAGPIIAWGGL